MSRLTSDEVIERGMALHKMIRMITLSLGGEGYLSFMGNEFGHPEWIDFPREGNGWSYFYCRRQWHLADDESLRYGDLLAFDKAMIGIAKEKDFFRTDASCLFIDADCQVLTYERNKTVFCFNFSPKNAYEGYWLTVPTIGKYKVVFSTDRSEFGGFDRISEEYIYTAKRHPDGKAKLQIYIPARTAFCIEKVKNGGKK